MAYMLDYPLWVLTTIIIHVLASVVALMSGAFAMRMRPGARSSGRSRGIKNHRRGGDTFFWSMMIACGSAALLLTVDFTVFLAILTVLSGYTAFMGKRLIKRKNGQKAQPIDWFATILAGVCGIVFAVWGVLTILDVWQARTPLFASILGIFFGWVMIDTVRPDLKSFRTPPSNKRWWLHYHVERMVSAYTALLIAFLIQMTTRWVPQSMAWMVWTLPILLVVPLMTRWANRALKDLESGRKHDDQEKESLAFGD